MGKVVVTYRVLPEGAETDVDALKDRIRQAFGDRVRDVTDRPLAFGLVGVEAAVVLEDAEGEVDRTDASLQKLEGVRSVETLSVDLL